jgi:RNA polymerase sigma-70 factor (ECF subfamily)
MGVEVDSPVAESLLRRIAQGDRTAVRECVELHGGLVLALARRLCLDPSDAEDAVQEIFIDLWASAARFDPALSSESTFVVMIARRRLIDRRRRILRRPGLAPLPEALASSEPSAFEAVDARDEAEQATRALDQLRPDQRRVLVLSIFDGLTYDQIARKTSLPLGTVKTHARRGLIRLRELLDARRPSNTGGEA